MAVLCEMLTIQYSARCARLSVHKLYNPCIRRVLMSRDPIVNGDWLPVTGLCRRYLPYCQPVSDVAENLGKFLVRIVQAIE